jgi:SAM-dependent methyltransferase
VLLNSAFGGARRQETAVSFFRNRVYPHLVSLLGNPKPIREVRQRIIPWAQGKVLEIGVGSGANFVHYDPAKVSKLYALEPNPGMVRLADRQRRKVALDVEFLDLPGERIPLADGAVDTVVSTFTLCTIPGVVEALRGLARVLKPDGKLIFFEVGLAPDPQVQRWQVRLERVYHSLFQGLSLTRDIPALIRQGGFGIEQMEAAYIAEFPKSSSYCWWGIALPQVGREVSTTPNPPLQQTGGA